MRRCPIELRRVLLSEFIADWVRIGARVCYRESTLVVLETPGDDDWLVIEVDEYGTIYHWRQFRDL